eukprot:1156463-Pelagomonas_calceolata.AAC.9
MAGTYPSVLALCLNLADAWGDAHCMQEGHPSHATVLVHCMRRWTQQGKGQTVHPTQHRVIVPQDRLNVWHLKFFSLIGTYLRYACEAKPK